MFCIIKWIQADDPLKTRCSLNQLMLILDLVSRIAGLFPELWNNWKYAFFLNRTFHIIEEDHFMEDSL